MNAGARSVPVAKLNEGLDQAVGGQGSTSDPNTGVPLDTTLTHPARTGKPKMPSARQGRGLCNTAISEHSRNQETAASDRRRICDMAYTAASASDRPTTAPAALAAVSRHSAR